MGPKVLVSTKSGANTLHGSLYEFLRNEKLDGTNFFANLSGAQKPTLRQNQFGGAIGEGADARRAQFGEVVFQARHDGQLQLVSLVQAGG
ncbi:MAG: hypothetical protein AAB225_10255 [Acidobacteriota bacterium]